jgi:hypothetical protein
MQKPDGASFTRQTSGAALNCDPIKGNNWVLIISNSRKKLGNENI